MKSPKALAAIAVLLGLLVLGVWLGRRDSAVAPSAGDAAAAAAAAADPTTGVRAGTEVATAADRADAADATAASGRTEVDPDPNAAECTVRGRVLAAAAMPIAGAEVVAYRGRAGEQSNMMSTMSLAQRGRQSSEADLPWLLGGPVLARARVEADGSFAFAVRERDLRLALEHDYYGLTVPEIVHVPARTLQARVVLAPYLGGCLRGRVLGEGTDTVDAVRLQFEPDPMSAARDPQGFMAAVMRSAIPARTPVEHACFTCRAVLPNTPLVLEAASAEAVGRAPQVPLAPGELREVALPLHAAQSLSLRVVDENDAPVAEANVIAHPLAAGNAMGDRAHGHTDAAGTVVLGGLLSGDYHVRAAQRGYVDAELDVTVPDTRTPDLVLRRGGDVRGVVVDRDGAPIAQATVAAIQSMTVPVLGDMTSQFGPDLLGKMAEDGVETDADGRFVLSGIEGDAPFHVIANHPGHAPAMQKDVTVGASDVRIELLPTAALQVRVVADEDGAPLAAFALALRQRMFLVLDRSVRDERFTAVDDGRVRLEDLVAGSFTLAATADGRGEATTSVTVVPGDVIDAGELRVPLGAGVSGRVVDARGAGIAGAMVKRSRGGMLDNPALAMLQAGDPPVRTDDDGKFALVGLTPGRLQLTASADGFAGATSSRLVLEAGAQINDVEIVLDHGGSVAGRLSTAPGEHAEDFSILVQNETTQKGGGCSPDADGTFRVDNLEPGRYQVQAMHPSVAAMLRGSQQDPRPGKGFDIGKMIQQVTDNTVSQRCTVRTGEVATVELDASELGAGVRLSVRVTVSGQTLDTGIVEATMLEDGRVRIGFLDRGTATFGALRPGQVRVQVRSGLTMTPVGGPQTVEIPDKTDHYRATIDLPGAELSGRVTDRESGQPLAAVLVRLLRAEDTGPDDMLGMAITDADGKFTFRALAAGTYGLVAADTLVQRRDGGTAQRLDGIRIGDGEHRTGIELRAQPAVGATVTVTDDLGNPLPGAMLLAVDDDGRPFGNFAIAFAGQDGVAQLGGLPRGRLRVVGRASGYAPDASAAVEVLPGQSVGLALRLRRGTRVVVDAVGRDGLPLRGVDIRARCNNGPWFPAMVLLEGSSQGDRLELGRLAAGDWEFRIEHPRTGTFTVRRSIGDGATVTILATPPD